MSFKIVKLIIKMAKHNETENLKNINKNKNNGGDNVFCGIGDDSSEEYIDCPCFNLLV